LQNADPALTIVLGDVMNPADVDTALPGHDAVQIARGAGAKGKIRAHGTRHVTAAMQAHGIRRLICLSSLGVGDSRGNLNFLWKYVMFGILLRRAYADRVAQEQAVRESGLDWTIVRPGTFVDGDVTDGYRHSFAQDTKDLKLKISRADVAGFMLGQLASDAYLRRSPGLPY
jgi:uncharacterized protein YbjT (DUF2867 family)